MVPCGTMALARADLNCHLTFQTLKETLKIPSALHVTTYAALMCKNWHIVHTLSPEAYPRWPSAHRTTIHFPEQHCKTPASRGLNHPAQNTRLHEPLSHCVGQCYHRYKAGPLGGPASIHEEGDPYEAILQAKGVQQDSQLKWKGGRARDSKQLTHNNQLIMCSSQASVQCAAATLPYA
jgi:hypothetical protein